MNLVNHIFHLILPIDGTRCRYLKQGISGKITKRSSKENSQIFIEHKFSLSMNKNDISTIDMDFDPLIKLGVLN